MVGVGFDDRLNPLEHVTVSLLFGDISNWMWNVYRANVDNVVWVCAIAFPDKSEGIEILDGRPRQLAVLLPKLLHHRVITRHEPVQRRLIGNGPLEGNVRPGAAVRLGQERLEGLNRFDQCVGFAQDDNSGAPHALSQFGERYCFLPGHSNPITRGRQLARDATASGQGHSNQAPS
jgi:hypothetical protein